MAEYTYTLSTASLFTIAPNLVNYCLIFNTGSGKIYLDEWKIINKPPAALTGIHQVWEVYRTNNTGSASTSSLNVFPNDTNNPGLPVKTQVFPADVTRTGTALAGYNMSTDEAQIFTPLVIYKNYGEGYTKRIVMNQNEGLVFMVGARAAGTSSFAEYITLNLVV